MNRSDSQNPFEVVNRTMVKSLGISIYRAILIAGVFASLYLQSHYASKEDVERIKNDVTDVKYTLRRISEQDDQLKDHEGRLRVLERDRH